MKKVYIKPESEVMKVWSLGNVLIEASPGIGGDYEPGMPIDSKDDYFDDEESWPNFDMWED